MKISLIHCHGHKVQKGVTPPQDVEERVRGFAGIREGVKPFSEAQPKDFGHWSKVREDSRFHAGFASAFVAEIHPVSKVFTVILRGVEETADASEATIQISKPPATESPDR
jgi:hypothetical protein